MLSGTCRNLYQKFKLKNISLNILANKIFKINIISRFGRAVVIQLEKLYQYIKFGKQMLSGTCRNLYQKFKLKNISLNILANKIFKINIISRFGRAVVIQLEKLYQYIKFGKQMLSGTCRNLYQKFKLKYISLNILANKIFKINIISRFGRGYDIHLEKLYQYIKFGKQMLSGTCRNLCQKFKLKNISLNILANKIFKINIISRFGRAVVIQLEKLYQYIKFGKQMLSGTCRNLCQKFKLKNISLNILANKIFKINIISRFGRAVVIQLEKLYQYIKFGKQMLSGTCRNLVQKFKLKNISLNILANKIFKINIISRF